MNSSLLFICSCLIGLSLAMWNSMLKMSGELEFHALNVGQGDALLIVTPDEHHILVDGGEGNSVLTELADELPFAFDEIDLLVMSHPHLDHLEGLIHVLKRMKVHAVLMSAPAYETLAYEALLRQIDDSGTPVFFADAGTDFRFGEVDMDVLYPWTSLTGEDMDNINNASQEILVSYEELTLLLTGDAEEEVEHAMLEAGLTPQAQILKAGHHGSRTSSTGEFLDVVQPEIMVISCGEGNSYGHPHPETLEKAAQRGIQVLRTDLDGRISLESCGENWHPSPGVFARVFRIRDQCS